MHTPGPWHVNAVSRGKIVGDETAPQWEKLMICNHNATVAAAYRSGDARLIAAAPDLLEAARGVDVLYSELGAALPDTVGTRAYDLVQEAVRKARAAISKAEGETPTCPVP